MTNGLLAICFGRAAQAGKAHELVRCYLGTGRQHRVDATVNSW